MTRREETGQNDLSMKSTTTEWEFLRNPIGRCKESALRKGADVGKETVTKHFRGKYRVLSGTKKSESRTERNAKRISSGPRDEVR